MSEILHIQTKQCLLNPSTLHPSLSNIQNINSLRKKKRKMAVQENATSRFLMPYYHNTVFWFFFPIFLELSREGFVLPRPCIRKYRLLNPKRQRFFLVLLCINYLSHGHKNTETPLSCVWKRSVNYISHNICHQCQHDCQALRKLPQVLLIAAATW